MHHPTRRLSVQGEWLSPRHDINSPDLYIPGILILIFRVGWVNVLIFCIQLWPLWPISSWLHSTREFMNDSIHRFVLVCFLTAMIYKVLVLLLYQILGESASRATAVIFFDFCFVKLGCYILNIQGSSQVIDIVAYGGYKFVGYIYLINNRVDTLTYDVTLISSVILSLAAGFLGATGFLWTMIFVYAFLSNAFFLVCLFYTSAISFFLFFWPSTARTASVSSLRCPPWNLQRTTYSRNFKNQFSSTSAPYHLFVHRGCHAGPLHGMVGEDISIVKIMFGYFLSLYNEFFVSLIIIADCMN